MEVTIVRDPPNTSDSASVSMRSSICVELAEAYTTSTSVAAIRASSRARRMVRTSGSGRSRQALSGTAAGRGDPEDLGHLKRGRRVVPLEPQAETALPITAASASAEWRDGFVRLTRIAHHTKAIVHPVEQAVDRIDAACDRGVEPALAQEIDGGHYGREARGLFLTDRRVRAAQLELEAHQAGSGISNGAVEQQRRRIRWSAIEECRQVLRRRSAASAIRAEDDTRAIVGIDRGFARRCRCAITNAVARCRPCDAASSAESLRGLESGCVPTTPSGTPLRTR